MSILLLKRPESGIVTAGLQAYYAFDEGSGQTLADLSGAGNDGTRGSTPGADTNDPLWTTAGLSYTVDDFVDCGASSTVRPDAWTVSIAMKTTPAATAPALGWHSTAQVPALYAAAPFNAQRPLIWLASNCFRYFEKDNPVNTQDGAWHFFSFTCPGNTAADITSAALRVDGLNQVVNSTTNTQDGATKDRCAIGAAGTVYFAEGETAFFTLHDRVLSEDEQDKMRSFAKKVLAGRVTLP